MIVMRFPFHCVKNCTSSAEHYFFFKERTPCVPVDTSKVLN